MYRVDDQSGEGFVETVKAAQECQAAGVLMLERVAWMTEKALDATRCDETYAETKKEFIEAIESMDRVAFAAFLRDCSNGMLTAFRHDQEAAFWNRVLIAAHAIEEGSEAVANGGAPE